MKRFLFVLLSLIVIVNLFAQDSIQQNLIFFYNAKLTNNDNIKVEGFDMDFHINTYKILQDAGILDSMFVRQNEKQLEYFDNMHWTYSAVFKVDKRQRKKDLAILNLENVDGNCDIYINKKHVAHLNNSFISYHLEIGKNLKKGKNKLEMRFSPKDSIRMRQRSPQYLYGWDWYPKTLAPHIGAIYLSFENDVPVIEYANIQTKNLDIHNDGTVNGNMLLNIHFRKPLKEKHNLILKNETNDFAYSVNYEYNIREELNPNGTCDYQLEFQIDNAKLWWPNLMGEQNLYSVSLCLDNTINDIYTTTFGIRTIELVQEKDSIGQSFYFKVNGWPFFAKGANYIMTYDNTDEDIFYAAAANMNMLRVWGGSDYGDEEFYNLCDKLGIMVWQDFPFACEMYPTDKDFIDNVFCEVQQNLWRITAHPSLALFCGNNEIWEGWNNWGWKENSKDSSQAVKDYNYLFKDVLSSLCKEYAPTINYIHSSPVNYGWGNKQSLKSGDCHYWGVWWADSNFETYTHKIGRFMSEYGFQGAMNQETAQIFCSLPYTKDNKDFAIHEKHPRGFGLIDNRLKEWFPKAKTDDEYISFSQAAQQEALKMAIESYRINKPYCMGSLFWQYNEPYPCIGWGCLDYSGVPKPAYYTAKMAYQPVIFAIDKRLGDTIKVYACSDLLFDTTITYSLKILNEKDLIKYSYIGNKVFLPAGKTVLVAALPLKNVKNFNKTNDYLKIEGYYGDEFISNYSFFVYPKNYCSFQKYLEVIFDYYFDDSVEEEQDD